MVRTRAIIAPIKSTMKRPLTHEEKEVSIKGLQSNEQKLKDLNEALENQQIHYNFFKQKCEWEDKTRAYQIKEQDKAYISNLENLKENIKITEFSIKSLRSQLNTGVDIKVKKEEK